MVHMASEAKRSRFLKPQEETLFSASLSVEKGECGIDGGRGAAATFISSANITIEQQRQRLPIFRWRNHLLYLLETHRVLVLVGETGSGKSTQVPQYIQESGWLEPGVTMAITQPRRVAAVTVASRVAEEKGWSLGGPVGYAIRFEECHSNETVIKFLTDGMLTRELLRDPLLRQYRVVMVDEAHERSLQTDIILGLLKKVLRKRPNDFRLIIASATLEADKFRDYFANVELSEEKGGLKNAVVLSVEGRQYPVDVHYLLEPAPCYLRAAKEAVLELHKHEPPGRDILVFLTGQEEVTQLTNDLIEENRRAITANEAKKKRISITRMRVLPLYSSLPHREQLRVFERNSSHTQQRKVVVSTNLAEASLTIPGIAFVVDCGFTKLPAYNPDTGVECLVRTAVSKASAEQRAGRAGRQSAGKVYRLFTEAAYNGLADHTPPEITRCDLSLAILQMKALGVDNVVRFDLLSPPPVRNMARSVELLYALGALDEKAHLTSPVGMRMAELPLQPMASAMLFAAVEMGCLAEAAAIAALMQIQNVFLVPSGQRRAAEKSRRRFCCLEGDHISQLNAFIAFERRGGVSAGSWGQQNWLNYRGLCRAVELRDQLRRVLTRFRLPWSSAKGDVEKVVKCLVKGFFAQAAQLAHDGKHYRTIRGDHPLHLHPNSVLYMEQWPRCVLFTDVVLGAQEYMENVTVIQAQLLYELAPHYYQYGTERERMERGVAALRTGHR